MEFNEKLQELRHRSGLTQAELADKLYVSRTAVSKWESGRGYPGIDSLKALARFFSVTIDELLSGELAQPAPEEASTPAAARRYDVVYGLLDCAAALLLLLPLFGVRAEGAVQAVSLMALTGVQPYVKATYLAAVSGIAAWGALTLALKDCHSALWERVKGWASLALTAAGVLLFIASPQPYAAAYLFMALVVKAILPVIWR